MAIGAATDAQRSGESHRMGTYSRRKAVNAALFLAALVFVLSVELFFATGANSASSQDGTKSCVLTPLEMPATPERIPGYTELDRSTGLHVTGTIQRIDIRTYKLEVTGKVKNSLRLAISDLRCMRRIEASPKLVCPGFFEDITTWAGVPLKTVIELAKPSTDAKEIHLVGADGYSATVPIKEAMSEKNFLAYEWTGKYLPELHGFPLRAVFPDMEGNRWVKWLIKIEVR